MSAEDLRERKLVWDKYLYEALSKKAAIELARLEANQANTVVSMHEIRSSIDGIVKTVYKNPGEAVKADPTFEPVFQILNMSRLRVEGVVDEHQLPRLKVGDEVDVEVPARAPSGAHRPSAGKTAVAGGTRSSSRPAWITLAWEAAASAAARKILHHWRACSPAFLPTRRWGSA